MDINKTKKALAIVKALAYAENNGKPDLKNTQAGKTGETKSIFQFTPDTWKIYSKQILGKDNEPINNENEAVVVHGKVDNWLKQGYTTEQIASMWNAGEQRPDAYKQGVKGVNKKYGVAYDTPGYAKKVADYAKQFELNQGVSTSETGNPPTPLNQSAPGLLGETKNETQKSAPFNLKRKVGMISQNQS